jgi:lipopolysaccharide/colanic/teichoic acid biosynthesis glycosyltransferase
VAASAFLVLTLPLLVLTAIVIKCECSGPVFVRRRRVGSGQQYTSLKFRTTWDGDPFGRLTRVGRFLRSTHIENVPEIVNVFRGTMTCIRPRSDRPFFLN